MRCSMGRSVGKVLGCAALVFALASPGMADTTVTSLNINGGQDAGMGRYDVHGNQGGSNALRVGKPINWKSYGIYDFDRAQIQIDLAAAAVAEGHASLSAAFAANAISCRFGLTGLATDGVKAVQVGSFESQRAWVEGSGSDADGHWPFPPDNQPQSHPAGRAYTTALGILILSLDKQYLPMYLRQKQLF